MASAQMLTIAGVQLEPSQTEVDLGELDDTTASQLTNYVGTNMALIKLTFATQQGRVTLAADVVSMGLQSKGIGMHGARIVASFLPRWCVFRITPVASPSSSRAFESCNPLLHLMVPNSTFLPLLVF